MGLTLAQLRAALLKATGTELSDWENGNTDLDLYINTSWWDIMDQFDFREKEAPIFSFDTVAGTRDYDIAAEISTTIFDALQQIVLVDENNQHIPLTLMSDKDYEANYNEDSDEQAIPQKYFRRGGLLYLWPTPDQVYTLNLYYLQVIDDIASGGPEIPQSWHEIIKYGAIWRALLDVQDFIKGDLIRKHQIALINNRTPVKVKELSDTRLAGVEVPGRTY
jgi:hypothetical protein